jgi:hypothetical protein
MSTVTATLGGSTSSTNINVSGGPDHLVISQLYGGGGNSGATFTHDFVELHNPTATPLMLAAGSLQYASSGGMASWVVNALPANLTIPAGGYLLIQLHSNAAVGAPLPTPDVAVTTSPIMMAATAGKVALVGSTTQLVGMCPPTGSSVIDLVGYGSAANCSEGMSPTPTLSAILSAQRKQAGCVDNDNNSADFTTGTPAPRNSATAPVICP